MGKQKSRRYRGKNRQDPIGTASAPTDAPNPSSRSRPSFKVSSDPLQQLGSAKGEDRSWSAAAISNLVLDTSTRTELLSGQVVVSLVNALRAETHFGVIVEMLVTLELIQLGCTDIILTQVSHIREVLMFMAEGKVPTKEEEVEQLKHKLEMAEQLFIVLWSFAEVSFDVVQTISSQEMLGLYFYVLETHATTPHGIVQSAAQVLNTITDDNTALCEVIRQEARAIQLLKEFSLGSIATYNTWEENRPLTRVLMASILFNLYGTDFELYKTLLHTINFVLQYNFSETFAKCSTITTASSDLLQSKATEDFLESVMSGLSTVQFTLELVTNMFSEETAEQGGWEDMDGDGDADDNGMDEERDTLEPMQDAAEISESLKTMQASLTLLDELKLIPQILKICGVSCQALLGAAPTAQVVSAASVVRVRAFGSLSNIFAIAASTEWFKGNASAFGSIWSELFAMAPRRLGEGGKADVVESVVSLLWAIARGFENVGGAALLPVTDSHITALIQFASAGSPSIRVMCIGTLTILAKVQNAIPRNQTVGTFFMHLLETEESVEVFAEVLNGIFDVYADQGVWIMTGLGFFERLRGKVKGLDKRKNRAVRERGDEGDYEPESVH
ncbi:hypothetical protein BC829DRAFT_381954 [Chytridium lagenaria]|nr:hypothetical protein BC829DRAFT_381954 [Chytridium lagenaria]